MAQPSRLLAGLALACLLAAPARCQTDPLPDREPQAPAASRNETVATVNGEIVTAADVEYRASFLSRAGRPVDAETTAVVLRQIAEDLLLAAECERLGVELTHLEVEQVWERLMGGAFPDLKQVAAEAGTSVEHQRDVARTMIQSRVYLYCKAGLPVAWGSRIPPDPVLQRVVSITPAMLREAYLEQKTYLDEPPSVTYDVYPCDGEEAGRAVQATLALGDLPAEPRGITEQAAIDRLPELFAFAPELASFLEDAVPGEVSEVTEYTRQGEDGTTGPSETAWLVVHVLERGEGKEADFEEIQAVLRNRILERRLALAKEQLVDDLVPQAVYWPRDLFSASVATTR